MNAIVVQLLVTFLLSMPTFMVAVGNAWTSYTLTILESANSPLGYKITPNDSNLLSSIIMLGCISSIGVGAYLNDKIGRKKTEILSGLCYVLAWSIITTAKTVTQLVIGRYVIGLGTGVHFVTGVVYIGEISQTSMRGPNFSILTFMYNVGTVVSYLEGWFCSYAVVNYLNLTVAVAFVLILISMKETPVYLLRLGKEKEAIRSLKFYRGSSTITQKILDEIVSMKSQLTNGTNSDKTDLEISSPNEKEKLNQENDNVCNTEEKSVLCMLRTLKSAQRALVTLIININLAVFMGMIAVQAYAGQFFLKAVPSLSPHLCSVLLAVVVTIFSGFSVLVVDLIPRRVLMIASCILAAACMACLATMLRWAWAPDWGIPVVMVLFCVIYNLGATNIPFVQISECLPPQMIGFGTCVVMCSMFLSNFTVLYVFQPAVEALGLDGVFLLFAITSSITALVAFLIMRETRKIPFEVVQNMFEHGYLYQRKIRLLVEH
ncbi:hypothetical protein PYW07_009334 [Mythimna separata]|uniref:Major facilitator superfamily (MFS) profile domain-containing protein n=1 Tax=Mythimna separata TaxID=271217 RepID=A0AAD8DM88_MYTSE|nr:hypothetical protein PYW07_009334 [Mythimna separata]